MHAMAMHAFVIDLTENLVQIITARAAKTRRRLQLLLLLLFAAASAAAFSCP